VAIVGALDIPLIHMSVYWFRSLHPEPVVLRPDGPTADPRMLVTLLVSLTAFTLVFAGLFWLRYSLEVANRTWQRHAVQVARPA
jgi:heme exporter protein C